MRCPAMGTGFSCYFRVVAAQEWRWSWVEGHSLEVLCEKCLVGVMRLCYGGCDRWGWVGRQQIDMRKV